MSKLLRTMLLGALAALLGPGVAGRTEAAAPPAKNLGAHRRAPGLDSAALARYIDRVIAERLRAENVTPSPRASDSEFVRRLYLDLVGHIPPADKVVEFLDGKLPDKRARLIDELLASPEYGRRQADIWQALLLPRNSDNRLFAQFYPQMVRWLTNGFNANRPWDDMVRDLLTASGDVGKEGPAVYFLANLGADKVTDSVSRLFFGVQLQCAQCHNHPFTDWKQDEYWGLAAFFMKVRPEGNFRRLLRREGSVAIGEGPGIAMRRRLPDSAKFLPPKFLNGPRPAVSRFEPYRPVLARWLATADNPYFARAMVNRTWAQLFGRGFVTPVDDMHDANPASHPELLSFIAKEFASSGFDVKYLIRAVCNSETYQRTSKPADNNLDAAVELFARMPIKALTPGQLFDSINLILDGQFMAAGRGMRFRGKMRRFAPTPRAQFMAFFQAEGDGDPTESQAGIPQALRLMNAPRLNNPGTALRLVKGIRDRDQAVERLYLATLSRRPTGTERERMAAYLRDQRGEPRKTLSDVLWALLNCSEFNLNH